MSWDGGIGVALSDRIPDPLLPPELGSSSPPQALNTVTHTNKPNRRLKNEIVFFMSIYY